ncbi:MAG: ATP-dependent DNA helicase [bacterium]|nr:ATP-dependent DNA helicase [bacterium]
MGKELLADLNRAQKEAVTFGEGPLLIVAGAGTGKTTVITRRIAWLIEQGKAKPEEILALTFTDKAASEMEERVDRLLPLGYVNVWISTFHAFGERVLRDYGLEIGLPNDCKVMTSAQQWMLIRNNLSRFNLQYYQPLGNPTRFIHALLQHFSRAKDEEVSPEDYLAYVQNLKLNSDLTVIASGEKQSPEIATLPAVARDDDDWARLEEVANAYHIYQQLLLEHGALDFGDLINYALKLVRTRPRVRDQLRKKFKYILVDEFQDTNFAQYELVKLLAAPGNNITVVGDDDQSVYKFRGASISNILEFKEDYINCKEIFLNENYRSFQEILDRAYEFIQLNNPYRLEVKLREKSGKQFSKKLTATRKGKGQVAHLSYETGNEEAEGVIKKMIELREKENASWSDFAILMRANSSAPLFLQALSRYKIPLEYIANRGLYFEPIILEVLNYLRILDNHHDSEALYRCLTREPFHLPHNDIVALAAFAKKRTISLFDTLSQTSGVALTPEGTSVIAKFLATLTAHTSYARAHSAAELYVKIIYDLGIEERVAHPALARDAEFLATFYQTIGRFEMEGEDKSMHAFLSYLDLELESGEEGQLPGNTEEGPDTVKIITVHSAKGLEWRFVFVVQLIDRRFPSTERREPIELPRALIKELLPEGDVHLQEERRLFYVALTRARDGLYLTSAKDYFGKTVRKPSQFLHELGFIKDESSVKEKTSRKEPRGILPVEIIPVVKNTPHYPTPDSFSFSSVSAFKKCPLEYKFRYLLKLPGAGAAQLSFGITIHKTLEEFLKLWKVRAQVSQGNLFDGVKKKDALPTFDELLELYSRAWIDDWYETAEQKNEYKSKRGISQLKNFYDHFVADPPQPKYLEAFFKIAMGPYKFVGKIDRIDEATSNSSPATGRGQGEGVTIIDYKTGEATPEKLKKVDKDQLIIYQIAAQDFLREKVVNAVYWHLQADHFSTPFLATAAQMEKLKEEYTEVISNILQTVANDSFVEADEHATAHDCKYKHLI